jgi:hypothetical protein
MTKNCATATNWRNHAVATACGGGSQQSFPPESWIAQKARKKLADRSIGRKMMPEAT